jgi:hypothetical protein
MAAELPQQLVHKNGLALLSVTVNSLEPAAAIEPDGVWVDVGIDAAARVSLGELGCQLEQPTPVSAALHVVAHGDTAEQSDLGVQIDSNDADGHGAVPKEKRVAIRPMVIGMVGVVRRSESAKFEQHSSANRVIGRPVSLGADSPKFRRHLSHRYAVFHEPQSQASKREAGEAEHERTRKNAVDVWRDKQTNPRPDDGPQGRFGDRAPNGDSSHERPRGQRCQNHTGCGSERRASKENLRPAHSPEASHARSQHRCQEAAQNEARARSNRGEPNGDFRDS